jgi:hypothetical protein
MTPRGTENVGDAVVAELASAVARAGWALTVTDRLVPCAVQVRSPAGGEVNLRLHVRSVGATLERVLELVALAQWRCHAGAWSLATGLLIRVPRLPAESGRWTTAIDRIRGSSTAGAVSLLICSARGGAILRLPGLSAVVTDEARAGDLMPLEPGLPRHEAALTVLKVLLAVSTRQTAGWWGGPTEPITTGSQLARLIGRSSATVYAVLEILAKRGWVRTGYGKPLRLLDPGAAAMWWLDQAKHQPRPLIPVRQVYGDPASTWEGVMAWLRTWHAGSAAGRQRWAISGWAACHLQGFGVVQHPQAKPVTVTMAGDRAAVASVLRSWSLITCAPHEAGFWIEPTAESGAALAATVVIDGLPVVDGWQAALDVAADPDRGIEQALAIVERLGLSTA